MTNDQALMTKEIPILKHMKIKLKVTQVQRRMRQLKGAAEAEQYAEEVTLQGGGDEGSVFGRGATGWVQLHITNREAWGKLEVGKEIEVSLAPAANDQGPSTNVQGNPNRQTGEGS